MKPAATAMLALYTLLVQPTDQATLGCTICLICATTAPATRSAKRTESKRCPSSLAAAAKRVRTRSKRSSEQLSPMTSSQVTAELQLCEHDSSASRRCSETQTLRSIRARIVRGIRCSLSAALCYSACQPRHRPGRRSGSMTRNSQIRLQVRRPLPPCRGRWNAVELDARSSLTAQHPRAAPTVAITLDMDTAATLVGGSFGRSLCIIARKRHQLPV